MNTYVRIMMRYKVLKWTSQWTVHEVKGLTFVANIPCCDEDSILKAESCCDKDELNTVIKEIEEKCLTP